MQRLLIRVRFQFYHYLYGYFYDFENATQGNRKLAWNREIENAKVYLKKVHPNSAVIAVDAAVGGESDVGIIKINPFGLKPGLGVDKDLSIIGDISIVGVVASRSIRNENLFNLTRLNFVYKMAGVIAGGIEEYIKRYSLYNDTVSVI